MRQSHGDRRGHRILLWLLMMAAALDKEGDALILGPVSFKPLPRNRLITDNFLPGKRSTPGGISNTNIADRRHGGTMNVLPPGSLPGHNIPRAGDLTATPTRPGRIDINSINGRPSGENVAPKGGDFNDKPYTIYPAYRPGNRFENPFQTQNSNNNSPFKNLFGTDIGNPSSGIPITFGNNNNIINNNLPQQKQVRFSARGKNNMGKFEDDKNVKYPFSSIRLNPIAQISGISAKRTTNFDYNQPYSKTNNEFLAGNHPLFSSGNRAESFEEINPFEKPIRQGAFPLPNVNEPITLDLAEDEQKRVLFLKRNKKLPPSRNFVDTLRNDASSRKDYSIPSANEEPDITVPPLRQIPLDKQHPQQNQGPKIGTPGKIHPKSNDHRHDQNHSTNKDQNLLPGMESNNGPAVSNLKQSPHAPNTSRTPQTNPRYTQANRLRDLNGAQRQAAFNSNGYPGKKEPGVKLPHGKVSLTNKNVSPSLQTNARHGSNKQNYNRHANAERKKLENEYSRQENKKTDNNDSNGDKFVDESIRNRGNYDVTILTDEKITKVPTTSKTEAKQGLRTLGANEGNNPAVKLVVERTIDSEGEKVLSTEEELPTDHIGFILTDDLYDDTSNKEDRPQNSNRYSTNDNQRQFNNMNPNKNIQNAEKQYRSPLLPDVNKEEENKVPYSENPKTTDKSLNEHETTSKSDTTHTDKGIAKSVYEDYSGNLETNTASNQFDKTRHPHTQDNLEKPDSLENIADSPPAVGSGYLRWPYPDFEKSPEVGEMESPNTASTINDYGDADETEKNDKVTEGRGSSVVLDTPPLELLYEEQKNGQSYNSKGENVPEENHHPKHVLDNSLGSKTDEIGILDDLSPASNYDVGNKFISNANRFETGNDKDISLSGEYLTDELEINKNKYPDSQTTLLAEDTTGLRRDVWGEDSHNKQQVYSDENARPLESVGKDISDLNLKLNLPVAENDKEVDDLRIGIMSEGESFDNDEEIVDKRNDREEIGVDARAEKESQEREQAGEEGRGEEVDGDSNSSPIQDDLTNKKAFSRETDDHEHINLDNLSEYLRETRENDQSYSNSDDTIRGGGTSRQNAAVANKNVVGDNLDENGIPIFKDYTYESFGKTKLPFLEKDEDGKGDNAGDKTKSDRDEFSINTDPVSSKFDILNAGEGSVSVRKVTNTFNDVESNINKPTFPLADDTDYESITKQPYLYKGDDNDAGSSSSSSNDVTSYPDSDTTNLSKSKKNAKPGHNDEGNESSLVGDVLDDVKNDKPESSSYSEDLEEGESEKGQVEVEGIGDEPSDKFFNPASSYDKYEFATPSSDGFSAQSAFVQSDPNPSSGFSPKFESLFGNSRSQQDTGSGSFRSLFQNINQDYLDSKNLGGKPAFQNDAGSKGFSGVFDGRNSLFDRQLGQIVEKRPSLRLFSKR